MVCEYRGSFTILNQSQHKSNNDKIISLCSKNIKITDITYSQYKGKNLTASLFSIVCKTPLVESSVGGLVVKWGEWGWRGLEGEG